MTFNTIGKIKTASGLWFDFNDPQPDQITIEDIAAALSKICRYNGHVPGFYSVAEHCCYVADWLDTNGHSHLAFAGLMHDAAEAYLGDIVNPMKKLYEFDRVYAPMEEIVETVIGDKFNVDLYPIDPIVKQADKAIYEWEVEHIRTGKVKGYDPELAYETFLAFYNHYKPPTNFTRESQMKNSPRIADMTDAEINYETEITWDSDINQPLTDGEKRLLEDVRGNPGDGPVKWFNELRQYDEEALEKAIADLDAESVDWKEDTFEEAEKTPWGPRRQMLMNAADLVDGDRNAQYGDPRQDFRRTAKYWNAHIHGVIDRKLAENGGQFQTEEILGIEDVAILMSLLKISRLAWGPGKEDTWTDLAGYAACGWHCVAPEEV
jgi:hypothetical protein